MKLQIEWLCFISYILKIHMNKHTLLNYGMMLTPNWIKIVNFFISQTLCNY